MNSLFAFIVALTNQFNPGLEHQAIPDSLVKEGKVLIQTRDISETIDYFQTRIKYNFTVKVLFTTREREGEETFTLPTSFKSEQGYLDLELNDVYEDSQVKLTHLRRADWQSFYDCHVVELIPKYKDTWDAEFLYCAQAPESGIVELRFRVKNVPIFGNHTIVSRWSDFE